MNHFQVHSVGEILANEKGTFIQLKSKYIPALRALEGFSHLNVLWWFHEFDHQDMRETLHTQQPYKKAPATMGIFATRSPIRPNPIALTAVQILHIDEVNGWIQIAYIDAHNGSPVLDLKPYTPSLDRVETALVPEWCAHWPQSLEDSAHFNWENEFTF